MIMIYLNLFQQKIYLIDMPEVDSVAIYNVNGEFIDKINRKYKGLKKI